MANQQKKEVQIYLDRYEKISLDGVDIAFKRIVKKYSKIPIKTFGDIEIFFKTLDFYFSRNEVEIIMDEIFHIKFF